MFSATLILKEHVLELFFFIYLCILMQDSKKAFQGDVHEIDKMSELEKQALKGNKE